jgi:phosphoribosylglycinamide formyltransferase-1
MTRLAIFASGTGSNAKKIIEHFKGHPAAEVALVVSNKADAPVLKMAASYGVATRVVSRASFYNTQQLLEHLQAERIDFIVLAGFLWLIPAYLVKAYSGKMINIHPALLPRYGGKGMYGMNVHKAVKAAGETHSGITIHYVNEEYDKGDVILQVQCKVEADDTPEQIAKKVQKLEHSHFAPTIEKLISEAKYPLMLNHNLKT